MRRHFPVKPLALLCWLMGFQTGAQAQNRDTANGRTPESGAKTGSESGVESGAEPTPTYGAVAVVPGLASTRRLGTVPRNVQRLQLDDLAEAHGNDLPGVLNARLGSVVLNDVQNNPLQPDLQYRGFTASPLLGSPQGIAIYQNGVRLNEPFGEVMQWDLVPTFAIREVQVMPGASPLSGLNALGGSLALQMKNGFRNPGHRVSALTGSFGRHRVSAEWGHELPSDWALFVGGSSFGEQGFRDESASNALHGFADLRTRTPQYELGIHLTLASTSLNGNGPAPVELLQNGGRNAVFTFPDNTQNHLVMVASDLDQRLGDTLSLQATAYARGLTRDTTNGDEGEFGLCGAEDMRFVCEEDGERVASESGASIASSIEYNGLHNSTHTSSAGYGGSLQLTHEDRLWSGDNQLVVGARYDGAHIDFLQRAELGMLTRDRSVNGQNVFLGGEAFRTKLGAENRIFGAYVSESFSPVEALTFSVAGRLNWVNVVLDDREGTALDGNHAFARLNPALGLAYSPLKALTLFASYSEANRAPSAAELACADPDEPCRLPNAFVADPPLEQVVTRGIELGARGHVGAEADPDLTWSLAAFGSRNFNDILFVAGSRVGTGYFRNAGQTQRIGVEAAVSGELGPVSLYLSYQLLRATFEGDLSLPAPETADDDDDDGASDDEAGEGVEVRRGDRIPGLPLHNVKAGVAVRPLPRLRIALATIARSAVFYRGDEGNDRAPLSGYVVLNAQVSYDVLDALQVFVRAQNLLNAEYETFGLLANPAEVLPGTADPRFVSPGAPLGVWAGLVVHD